VGRLFGPAALAALAVVAACGQPAGPLSLSLVPPTSSTPAVIRVTGLSSRELSALAGAALDETRGQAILRVSVDGTDAGAPLVSGQLAVSAAGLEFTPRYPLDPGRAYVAVFDPARLPTPRPDATLRTVVRLPAVARTPTTTVVRMLPTAATLPENLLRMYVEFSAPMAREHGREFLTLLDDRGREVKDAFLALDVDFWSPDGRRYTVFLDPGRVKRGILPNDQFGRALTPGRTFTIAIDPKWRDANGQPLAAAFRHDFGVSAVDMAPIRPADWRLAAPGAGTRDPLVVTFPKPLDHGLLQRALGVTRSGAVIAGVIEVGPGELTWRFSPQDAWAAGSYDLLALSILEDPMGNKIGRPFDIDTFDRIDETPAPERTTIPFVVR
jgi:hypothetical protein